MIIPNTDPLATAAEYRYGFQGQEKDNEIKGGDGKSINYTFRMHDPRIGRFFAVDPMAQIYAWNSPYAFSENRVIDAIESEGLQSSRIQRIAYCKQYLSAVGEAIAITKAQLGASTNKKLQAQLRSRLLLQQTGYSRVVNILYKEVKLQKELQETMQDVSEVVTKVTSLLSEGTHAALDGIGLIPVVGEWADGTNALMYAYEGDYINAGLSASATVPFIGWGATGAKWTRNVLKVTGEVAETSSGLIFRSYGGGHRLSHVLLHEKNDLTKKLHGVFDTGKNGTIATIDEAWEMAQKGGANVAKTVNQQTGRITYVVNMGRKVGYEGGKNGSGAALNKVQIVIEKGTKSDVVTAFPVK